MCSSFKNSREKYRMDIFHAMGCEVYIRPGAKVFNQSAYGRHLQRGVLSAGVAMGFRQEAVAGRVVADTAAVRHKYCPDGICGLTSLR
jgi:hypothetical protein